MTYKHIPPYRIYVDITRSCPLQCRHCYAAQDSSAGTEELSLRELKDLVLQLKAAGIENLTVSGGEPLARADVFEFLSFCSDQKMNTTLLTNGVLIDSGNSRILAELNVDVRLSLDGLSEKSHDYVRGKGNLECVLGALKTLREAGLEKLSLHFTVNRLNIPDILRVPYFLRSIGVRDVVIGRIKPVGRVLSYPELLIRPEDVLLVQTRLDMIYTNKSIRYHFYKEKNWSGIACPAAHAKCGITADGRITPCAFLGPDFVGESIRRHSFEYLWHHDTMMEKLRKPAADHACAGCPRVSKCHGGCPARALYFNRGFNGGDPYCCEINRRERAGIPY